MDEFWVGVCSGFVAAFIFFCVAFIVIDGSNTKLKKEMKELQHTQHEILRQVEEHEKVMRTYEFFNESWTAQMRGEIDERTENEPQESKSNSNFGFSVVQAKQEAKQE